MSEPKLPTLVEQTVVLPPFVVTGDKRPWLYGSLPGFEILSRASEAHTRRLVLTYLRSWWTENTIIPEGWLHRPAMPYTIIIDETDPEISSVSIAAPALTQDSNFDMFGWSLSGYKYPSLANKVSPLKGWIHAADEDTTVLGANLYGGPSFLHAPTWLDRLDRCAPSLPSWVLAGLVGRCGIFEDRTNTVLVVSRDPGRASVAIFRGIRWGSSSDSVNLVKEFPRHRGPVDFPFIPLAEFFSESPPAPDRKLLWESEAGLLVRWGLLEPRGRKQKLRQERRAQFIKFVERQKREPVTEQMLIDCFGRGSAAIEQELKEYLRNTLGKEIQVELAVLQQFPGVAFNPATSEQIGRITGDWLRMQGESLQNRQPKLSKEFLDATDRVLTRAWLQNSPLPAVARSDATAESEVLSALLKSGKISAEWIGDPNFLAVCGIYEHNIGEYEIARDLLERAAVSKTKRPKAYVLLAGLRFREAVNRPEGSNGTLSEGQAVHILQTLKTALPHATNSRPWRLMVNTLVRCESRPSLENLEVIVKGATQFPRDSLLQLYTARLCLQSGERERAMDVINKSLPLVVDERIRNEFRQLIDAIQRVGSG